MILSVDEASLTMHGIVNCPIPYTRTDENPHSRVATGLIRLHMLHKDAEVNRARGAVDRAGTAA
jgi:hypothetical protein